MNQTPFTLFFAMKYVYALWLLVAGMLHAQVFDDPAFRPQALKGMNQTYNFAFEAAHETLQALENKYPDHPAPYFLQAVNRWWQTYLSVTMPDYYDYIEERLAIAEDKIDDLEDQAAYAPELAFFGFMVHALEARTYAYRNQWWSAMGAARHTIDPLEDCLDYLGQQPEFDMVAGVYHYYVATYHKSHPMIRPVLSFFPPGDVQQGLKEMQQAANTPGHLAQVEAMYFLGTIYNDEINRPSQGVAMTRRLSERYPRNTWFRNDYARALIGAGQEQKAQAVLDELINHYQSQAGHNSRNITSQSSRHTTYLMMRVYHNRAQVEMKSGDYRSALGYLAQSNHMAELAKVEEDFYLPANQLYMGMCYDYLGQRDQAIDAYEAVLDLDENEPYKADAQRYLKTPAKR
jgi:tetratricopeptide (TPR) repeat protein